MGLTKTEMELHRETVLTFKLTICKQKVGIKFLGLKVTNGIA